MAQESWATVMMDGWELAGASTRSRSLSQISSPRFSSACVHVGNQHRRKNNSVIFFLLGEVGALNNSVSDVSILKDPPRILIFQISRSDLISKNILDTLRMTDWWRYLSIYGSNSVYMS